MRRYLSFLLVALVSLLSCSHREAGEVLDTKSEARQALLRTQEQYRNYIIPSSDSLISLAADYYEEEGDEEEKFYAYLYQGLTRYELRDYEGSSQSFMRALSNSSAIDDGYAMGQMYDHIALINLIFHCSDAYGYAQKAYTAFSSHNLTDYAANALIVIASYYLHSQQFDSCRIVLDEAVMEAKLLSDTFLLNEAESVKAQYAICVDSVSLAEELLCNLMEHSDYVLQPRDIATLATISAYNGDTASARKYLHEIRQSCVDFNDSIFYYTSSYWVNRISGSLREMSLCQDTLLKIEERVISEKFRHTSIASQKEYAEMNLKRAEHRGRTMTILIIGLLLLLMLIICLSVLLLQKKRIEILLLHKTIQKMEMDKELHAVDYEKALFSLKSDAFIQSIQAVARSNRGLSASELYRLNSLFCEKLPHFESSLRELISLSETEWQICMLLKISCSPGDIAVLLNKSAGAISSARIRMYQKVFHKKGHTNDWDAFINGI
ncbi:MAG: hypothetical protein KBT20_01250 [Bacteroidales bacterium]|nr:hypothetical protein [Candidatus Liminaster caballi]